MIYLCNFGVLSWLLIAQDTSSLHAVEAAWAELGEICMKIKESPVLGFCPILGWAVLMKWACIGSHCVVTGREHWEWDQRGDWSREEGQSTVSLPRDLHLDVLHSMLSSFPCAVLLLGSVVCPCTWTVALKMDQTLTVGQLYKWEQDLFLALKKDFNLALRWGSVLGCITFYIIKWILFLLLLLMCTVCCLK